MKNSMQRQRPASHAHQSHRSVLIMHRPRPASRRYGTHFRHRIPCEINSSIDYLRLLSRCMQDCISCNDCVINNVVCSWFQTSVYRHCPASCYWHRAGQQGQGDCSTHRGWCCFKLITRKWIFWLLIKWFMYHRLQSGTRHANKSRQACWPLSHSRLEI